MTDIAELERRVAALEVAQSDTVKSQRWMAATLGRIAAVQDEHTKDLTAIKADLSSLRRDLPSIVADALREVLKVGGA